MKNPLLLILLTGILCFALGCNTQTEQGITEENAKALMDRVLEIWNKGNMALIAEVYAPEVITHTSSVPEDLIGHEGIKNWVESTRTSYPDLNMTFDEVFISGDKIVAIWTFTGTNTGPMSMPSAVLPPTGKNIRVTGLSVDYLQNGKIVKEIVIMNVLDMMMQLGFTLNPPQTQE